MKLLVKTSRIYLIVSLVIYLVAGVVFYGIVKYMIYDEVETRLLLEKRDFIFFVRTHPSWNSDYHFVENKVDLEPAHGKFDPAVTFIDTVIVNKYDQLSLPFRQITFQTEIGGVLHKVSIRKSMIESYKLIEAISAMMVLFLALLMITMYVFQRRLSVKIWEPFYLTLTKIKEFDLTKKEKLELPVSEITEFNELEDVLKKMGDKMQYDYMSLREFTENASHEMQTPLALINARVEQFIQSGDLSQKHTYWIEEIYRASRKISRLNQGLLLLAKIDNQQFSEIGVIDLADILDKRLADFEDVLMHKEIEVRKLLREPFYHEMSLALAEILFNNLLNNAVRHNDADGYILLESSANEIQISNTGPDLKGDPNRLFQRFKKDSTDAESIGLGLSIVQQICNNYQLKLEYLFRHPIHTIRITRDTSETNG